MNWRKICFIGLLNVLTAFSAMATVDTVNTYSGLRLYSGVSDSIFVNHPRYHGVFYKDSCATENFGTILRSTAMLGICWRRIANNFSPRFWEIGGASPDNSVGIVVEEIDAINSAAMAAFQAGGDTIEIDSMYEIDRPVSLITHNTYLGVGDSVGFVRKNSPKTVLTAPTQIGDDSIRVQSNFGFRNRNKINIANDQAYDSIAGFVSYNIYLSNNLGNDSVVYISGRKIQKAMDVGDSVGLFFVMMRPRFSQLDSVYIKNLIFDGNRSSYTLNYDWRVATTIMLTSTNEALIEDCRFYETPAENIFLCGASFKNCHGQGLNGSILHFSCQPNKYITNVLYNNFKNVNEVPDAIMSHSEAAFTFSAKVRNLRVAYNYIEGIGEHGLGRFSNDDYNNEITDNLLNTDKDEVNFLAFYTSPDSNIVYNNKNLNKADTSVGPCIIKAPEPRGVFPCVGNSSLQIPLGLGDRFTISIDSL
ncbi:MAG: hypothetical protein JKY48_15135, partial [Flavobacteriales bacterium]|nr:hypothetical protein [Flavobacteriales bacterium]